MDSDAKTPDNDQKDTTPTATAATSAESQTAPADALSRTPDDLEAEAKEKAKQTGESPTASAAKKHSKLYLMLRRINVYFLAFLLILVVTGVFLYVNYLNSQKTPPDPTVASKSLSQEELKQLANTDVSVGSASQTMTIKGNTIIDGQTLARGNLDVAGNFQAGGAIQGSKLTIAGDATLGQTQVSSLQIAQNLSVQGTTSLRDLSVSGTASFSGAVSAPQLTVSKLIISNGGGLEIPGHATYSGPPAGRGSTGSALGAGGSASISGNDTTGTVNVNTGTGTAAGCFIRVNFNQAFGGQPHVIISPVGAGAGLTNYYVDRNQAGFSICAASPAPINQSFAFDYFVAG